MNAHGPTPRTFASYDDARLIGQSMTSREDKTLAVVATAIAATLTTTLVLDLMLGRLDPASTAALGTAASASVLTAWKVTTSSVPK
jgi:hypothetical protein